MSISNELVTFVPKKEKDAESNLQQFIEFCRNKLTTYGAGLIFNNNEWDISDYVILKGMANKRIRLRFYTYRSLALPKPESFLEPYNSFSKAYIRYINAFQQLKSFSFIMGAIRMIYEALNEINEVNPTKIDARVLNRAAQLTTKNYSPGTAANLAGHIEKIARFLGEHQLTFSPVWDWKSPVKQKRNLTRVGQAFDEVRAKKMPSAAALNSLPRVFRLAEETPFVLVSSIAAILCSAPDRINEILLLPNFCEAHQRAPDGSEAYGLRWWPAKGAEPMVKWIVPSMVEVVAEALEKIRRCTERAREVARWYEKNPHKVYLLPEYEYLREKPLLRNREVGFILFGKATNRSVINEWYRNNGINTVSIKGKYYVQFNDIERFVVSQLPHGFPWLNAELGLKFSDALCVSLRNDLAADKASWVGIIQGISVNQVNNRLGHNPGSRHITIFERYGFTEPDGSPIKVTTHQFRHYLNTLAQAGGLSQLDIAKWSGRKDVRQNATYDHVSADELVHKIRNALGDDRQMYGPLAELPPRAVIRRDEFARLKVPTAHTTEFGVCIHDYTMSPCHMHADCLSCNEQVCIKGDVVRTARLHAELETAKENLEAAQQAQGDGFFGANRWVEHHQLTIERLSQLCTILDDPQVPAGAIVQLSNLPTVSRIEHAAKTRAAVEHKQVASSPSTASIDAIRNILAGMGNVNG